MYTATALDTATTAQGIDRRQAPRFPVCEEGTLHLANPHGEGQQPISVINVSNGGMKLRLTQPLAIGSEIHVALKNLFVLAEVRYCSPIPDGFHAGIMFRETTLLAKDAAKPIPV